MENSEKLQREDYARAESFLPWYVEKRVYNAEVKPNWIKRGEEQLNKFWYLNKGKNGLQFKLVDVENDYVETAFHHVRLAAALSQATGQYYEANQLPFEKIEKQTWECDLESYDCRQIDEKPQKNPAHLISPDGKWAAFTKKFNIFILNLETGEEIQLTKDGKQYFDYGTSPETNTLAVTVRKFAGMIPPFAIWSPDSKKLLTQHIDQRKVTELHLLQHVPPEGQRPVVHSYRYAMPGDKEIAKVKIAVLDVETQSVVNADIKDYKTSLMGPVELKHLWWAEDGQSYYVIQVERACKAAHLYQVDAQTGESKKMLTESGSTYIELNPYIGAPPNVRILENSGLIIWPSERDGWANLHLYDLASGEYRNPITAGQFVVYDIKHVDEEGEWVYFAAGCHEIERDPYYHHLYRVKFDGTNLQLLTPEDAHHEISFAPGGSCFVDKYSRIDSAPVTNLRHCDGVLLRTLEEADAAELEQMGWIAPEPFRVKARDNVTDIYGSIFRPTHFDPQKSYPVIDSIYPGPQHIRTPKGFVPDSAQALAELGFIVVTIDGLGNMGRSKAHHDLSYGKFTEAGGLEDHIYGLRQLAERYSYMDLERVGIYGHSGGGFASTKAILTFPDFYKVAVSSAGNHDQRGYVVDWGELYNGLVDGDNYVAQANAQYAKNLKGRLLLVAGDMDDNVHPALTWQVADELIKADKDFDMLIMPNRNHYFPNDGYFLRRLWDYFVRYLLEKEPPRDYALDKSKIPPMKPPMLG